MAEPEVSVIVVGYKDADRIGTAIESVLRQSLANLEVIVVDDCSPDHTEEVVNEYVTKDSRVRFHKLPTNTGSASGPRNAGIKMARGEWIVFVDSDDTLEQHAVKNLLRAVEETGADLGCGASIRIDVNSGRRKAWWPEQHERTRVLSSITQMPELVFDQLVTNKIFRKSMFIEHDMKFAEGFFYQDMLWMIQCYTFAKTIVVIPEVVHYWMVDRLADDLSVSQRRHEVTNIGHRIAMNRRMDEFLEGRPEIQDIKDRKFFNHDANLYMTTLLSVDDESAEQIMEQLIPYVESKNLEFALETRPGIRIAFYHLLKRDLAGLRRAMMFAKWASVMPVGYDRRGLRLTWNCSHANDPDAAPWLDITETHVDLVPFNQFRFLSIANEFNGAASGVTYDPCDLIEDADVLELIAMTSGDVAQAVLPLHVDRIGKELHWRTEGRGVWVREPADRGLMGVRIRRGAIVNTTALRYDPMSFPNGELAIADAVVKISSYERGGVGWSRPEGSVIVQPEALPTAGSALSDVDIPSDRSLYVIELEKDAPVPSSMDVEALASVVNPNVYVVLKADKRVKVPVKTRFFIRSTEDPHVLEVAKRNATAVLTELPDTVDELAARLS